MIYNLINYIRGVTKSAPQNLETRLLTPEVSNLSEFNSQEKLKTTIAASFGKTNIASRKHWCALYPVPDSSCLFPPIKINAHKKILGRQAFNSKDVNISTFHFIISYQVGSDETFIIDRSKNGTFVNGLRVAYERPVKIHSGYKISLSQPNGKLGVPHFIFYKISSQERPSKNYQLENKIPYSQYGTKLNVLSSEIECFLCKQIFTNCLVVYPCYHSFCGACLLFERFPSHCSLCNTLIQGIRPNYLMNNIVEEYLNVNPRLKLHPALEKIHNLAKEHVKKIIEFISSTELESSYANHGFGYDVNSSHLNDTFEELLSLHLKIQDDNSLKMKSTVEIDQGLYNFLKKRALIKDLISVAIELLKNSAHGLLLDQQSLDFNPLNSKRYESVDYNMEQRLLMSPETYNQTVICSQCNLSFHLPALKEKSECTFCHRFFCGAVKRCSSVTEADKTGHFFAALSSSTPSRNPISWAWGNDYESEIVQAALNELDLSLSDLYEKILWMLALRRLRWENSYLANQGASLNSFSCQDCLCDLVLPELVFLARPFIQPQFSVTRPFFVKDCSQGRLCQEQKISEHHRIHFNHYCPPNPFI